MNGPSNNDFTVKFANVNGTGSSSANGMFMKSVFRMGIPVVGKNYFPSNIQGLPTWYEVRINENGYLAPSGRVDIMVAMNAQTYQQDLKDIEPGGYLIYDSTWPRETLMIRDDITVLGVPLAKMCNEAFDSARSRTLMKNTTYVGVLAALLGMDMKVIEQLLLDTFGSKTHLIDANKQALMMGFEYAEDNFNCPLPFKTVTSDKTKGYFMLDGNSTAALGCLYAGATVGSWYPITPSTSLMDAFNKYCSAFRIDEDTKKNNFSVIQAEDELSAIGMALGAGWNGARSFTPTSGPGVSLMNEFIGFGYYAEIPTVIFDVQRTGPSTGMPTRTQQCDILSCAYASHGDTKHVCLYPANPEEAFYLSVDAFDIAEQLQTPVFVLSDLDIGMNDWMIKNLEWDDKYIPNRGKVLDRDTLEGIEKFHRYLDSDGDGIPYRTIPGAHPKGAYFTRGSGHNKFGGYTEDANEYQDVVDRLLIKWETAKSLVPSPIKDFKKKNKMAILSIGSCDDAIREARNVMSKEGNDFNYLRVRAFPFSKEVEKFINAHEIVFIIEQNRDGQLKKLIQTETSCDTKKLKSIRLYNGIPIFSKDIVERIMKEVSKGKKG
ncbi:MAG: ferredoxin oxidoreductase [Gammaproteobacteria bacterium]|nr:ferredoxin oxidoreductase [Gammaproteobacteria bacterium]